MYQRMEEEWSRRELGRSCRLVPETDEGHGGREETQRWKSETGAEARRLKLAAEEKPMRIWDEKEEKVKIELRREEEEHDSSEESTEMKASLAAPCWLNTSQGFEVDPIRKVAEINNQFSGERLRL